MSWVVLHLSGHGRPGKEVVVTLSFGKNEIVLASELWDLYRQYILGSKWHRQVNRLIDEEREKILFVYNLQA